MFAKKKWYLREHWETHLLNWSIHDVRLYKEKFKFINSKRTLSTLIQEWRTEGLNVWNWRQKAKWFHTHSVAVCASTLAASGTLTGQITPQSAIHCCLSICMFFSRSVTWHFQAAPSHVVFSLSDQSCRCFKWSHVDLVSQMFNTCCVLVGDFWSCITNKTFCNNLFLCKIFPDVKW